MDDALLVVLTQQWFTHNEALLYIAMSQYGGTTAGRLSSITAINRATVYTALNEMKKKGWVYTLKKNDVIVFYPTDYKTIFSGVEKKYHSFKDTLPQFEKIVNQFTHQKERLDYYDGLAGVKKAFELTLKSETPIYAFINYGTYYNYPELHQWANEYYSPHRHTNNIHAYCIMDDSEASHIYDDQFGDDLTHNKICTQPYFKIYGEINIFDNNKVMHIYANGPTYYATVHISDTYYSTMYSLWKTIREMA